jgi:hypothetical protein
MQKAIVGLVNNDPTIGAPIYDVVPSGVAKPYISFGPFQALPEHGSCLDGGEIFITLDCWTGGPDRGVTVKQLGAALATAIDLADITIDAPPRLVEMTVEQIQYMTDPDGLTSHAVITVHAFTD